MLCSELFERKVFSQLNGVVRFNAHWAELGRIGSKILNSEAIFTKTLMVYMSTP